MSVCGICGRPLVDEESRARGIGPVCWRELNESAEPWARLAREFYGIGEPVDEAST